MKLMKSARLRVKGGGGTRARAIFAFTWGGVLVALVAASCADADGESSTTDASKDVEIFDGVGGSDEAAPRDAWAEDVVDAFQSDFLDSRRDAACATPHELVCLYGLPGKQC